MNNFVCYLKKKEELLFFLLNRTLVYSPLAVVMHIFTFFGSAAFAVGLCLFALFFSFDFFLYLASAVIVCQIIVQTLKRIFTRQRPCHALTEVLFKKSPPLNSYSFPSGHTSTAFSIALTCMIFFPAFTWLFYLTAVFVGISRIVLGVHYPTDVVIGAVLGFFSHVLSVILLSMIL